MLCAQFLLVKPGDRSDDVLPLACRAWDCQYCAPRRKARLIAQAAAGNPNKLLTLTAKPKEGETPTERLTLLHTAWKKLTKRIMRKYHWPKLHYLAVVEKTKRGEPHLHILLRCGFIPQRWLSAQMQELAGAPVVDIRAIHNARHAIRYVTKYIGKAPGKFGTHQRYWMSRDWEQVKVDDDTTNQYDPYTMHITRQSWRDFIYDRHSTGWTVEQLDTGWFRWHRPGARGAPPGDEAHQLGD